MEGLVVRPARPEDREEVLRFCEHTWKDFGDYIADVWDDWLADQEGVFLVGELEGKPVAIGKVTVLSPGEIWLEGLRVAPEVRGQGVANAYMRGQRSYLAQLRPHTLRLATGSHNIAVHHMMEKGQFERVATYAHFRSEADEEIIAPHPQVFSTDDLPEIRVLLDHSEAFAAAHRLYAVGWRWPVLTEDRLVQHLRAGEVVGYRDKDGAIAALAITPRAKDFYEDAGRLWLGLLDGDPQAGIDLARALRRQAAAMPDREVVAFVPQDTPWPAVLEEAGYVEEQAMGFWIFERQVRPPS